MVTFLIKGASFDRFKAGLRRFIYSLTTLEEALCYCDSKVVRKLLEERFDLVAKDEYS
jgi:hypothetical protein